MQSAVRIVCIVLTLCIHRGAGCVTGWFGPNCQYKCRCAGEKCDGDGHCTNNSTCSIGWFGYKCQYYDLIKDTARYSSLPVWMIDNNMNTCNNDSLQNLTLLWKTGYFIRSLRMVLLTPVRNVQQDNGLAITFYTAAGNKSSNIDCDIRYAVINTCTVDVYCGGTDRLIQAIDISGPVINDLCSIHINGGRNLALGQRTEQSSNYVSSYVSANAVDGNTTQNFNRNSCTHTDPGESASKWTLFFSNLVVINRFVLYGRNDCCSDRLINFLLQTFDDNNSLVINYTDSRNLSIYDVSFAANTAIKKVSITIVRNPLTLCEVEAYGDCPAGVWGLECNNTCEVVNKCSLACNEGDDEACYTSCSRLINASECSKGTEEDNVGAIIGPIIAVLVLAAIIIMVLYYLRKKGKVCKKRSTELELDNINKANEEKIKDDSQYENTELGLNVDTSIHVQELNTFVSNSEPGFYSAQFKMIPPARSVTTNVATSLENRSKNRYKNICPYDHSRVHLIKNDSKNEGDYINASHIKGYNDEEHFIAAQAPTKLILNDFVRMLWEQKIGKVVMLTNLVENGKKKCEQYWPDEGTTHFGDIKLSLKATHVFADYTVRSLELSKRHEDKQTVTQFHFTSWPDKDVPPTPWSLVEFKYRVSFTPTDRPIVVHCSAGIGRTGTYIAMSNAMKQAEKSGRVDFFKTVTSLRQDRVDMIQTTYEFLHKAVQVAIMCHGATITANVFCDKYRQLDSPTNTEYKQLQKEFRNLCTVCKCLRTVKMENEKYENIEDVHKAKQSVISADSISEEFNHRPVIEMDNKEMGYFNNALQLPSFNQKGHQILTELPSASNLADFWRLVTQYNISLVVAFIKNDIDSNKNSVQYFSTSLEDSLTISPFEIKTANLKRLEFCEQCHLTVTNKKSFFKSENHNVVHVKCQFTDLDVNRMVSLMKYIRGGIVSGGRVMFMCKNGTEFSGLAFVLSQLMDRLDHDLCLTIPLVVGAVKCIRNKIIQDEEQYIFIHQVLQRCIDISFNYNNVGEDFLQKGAAHFK